MARQATKAGQSAARSRAPGFLLLLLRRARAVQLPIGVIVFPGSGIVENLADKARKMGIPVWRFE
ncbi:MAG: hypothetical protein WA156_05770 [Methylocystis silviterrae]